MNSLRFFIFTIFIFSIGTGELINLQVLDFESERELKKYMKTICQRIKSLKQILPFVTHDIMSNYKVFDKLNIKVKFISVYRSPIELVY